MSDMKEIAYDVAKARILIERGDLEGAQCCLDDASSRIPDDDWPTEAELEDGGEESKVEECPICGLSYDDDVTIANHGCCYDCLHERTMNNTTEYCDRCYTELEEGRIGLCDGCQSLEEEA